MGDIASETNLPPLMGDVARALLGKPSSQTKNELRYGNKGSLSIDLEKGTWFDHESEHGGGVLALVQRVQSCDKTSAIKWLQSKGFAEQESARCFYDYRDEGGAIVYRVERKAGHKFLHHGPDGQGGFVCRKGCMAGIDRILYRLPELLTADRGDAVFICEGEKDADRLASLGLVATCNSGGAGKFVAAQAKHLKGRKAVILQDNDSAGRDHARDVLAKIKGVVSKVSILALPDLPSGGDVSDWLNAGGTKAKLVELAHDAPESVYDVGEIEQGPLFMSGVSAKDLVAKKFEPIRWIIPGYLPEGMAVLAGAPKLGKTWLALDWMLAVASGGNAMGSAPCPKGDVLGLMLEDNERRLQNRLQQMQRDELPDRLRLLTDWPNLDDGCVEEIEAWIASANEPRLIVIDVFARVKGGKGSKETDYDSDYRQAAKLQSIASKHNLALIVIHHTRKQSADDPFDEVSGTRGLTGAADTVLVLKRDGGTKQPVIYGRGRDLEEVETAVQFDKDAGRWEIIGEAWQVADTHERREIQQVLGRSTDPLSPKEIAEIIGKSSANVQKMLSKMEDAGQVTRASRGAYVLVVSVDNPALVSPITTKTTTDIMEESKSWIGESPDQTRARLAGVK
jgi:predicted transcriptional regulator